MDPRSWARSFRDALGLPALLSAEQVAGIVGRDASYVSAGLVDVVHDASPMVGQRASGRPGRAPHGRVTGLLPPRTDQPQPGVLALTGTRLSLLRADGEAWSCSTWSMRSLVVARPSGFILLASGAGDLVASVQVPVTVPLNARWRTVPRVSGMFGGWDTELGRCGVPAYS